MNIKQLTGKITKVVDLSETSRDVEILLSEPFDFEAGSFVNIFMEIDGEKVRRAYSISSSPKLAKDTNQPRINISVRLTPNGKMSPKFWDENSVGEEIKIMGPLGLNTADKFNSKNKYLFGFGIGVGVIKSLAENFKKNSHTEKVTIVMGHKYESEILYKEFFNNLSNLFEVKYIISRPKNSNSEYLSGYIQDNIEQYDFNNSDIYICGQEKACNQLQEKILEKKTINYKFFIEGFH